MAVSVCKPGFSSRILCSLWHTLWMVTLPSTLDLFHEHILTHGCKWKWRVQIPSQLEKDAGPGFFLLFFPTLWKWQGLENLRHQRLGQHSTAASSGPWWLLDLKPYESLLHTLEFLFQLINSSILFPMRCCSYPPDIIF